MKTITNSFCFFFLFTWKYNKSNEASWVEIDWYRVGAVKHTKAVALTWFNDQFSLLVLLLHRSQTHCIFSHVWFSSLYILYTHSYNYCGANYIHWMLKCWYGSLEKSGYQKRGLQLKSRDLRALVRNNRVDTMCGIPVLSSLSSLVSPLVYFSSSWSSLYSFLPSFLIRLYFLTRVIVIFDRGMQ